ncbi:MAG: hypothetical protein AAF085_00835 [Planctomycetota bacterium]
MSQWIQHLVKAPARVGACLVMVAGLTGCSVFDSSYVIEPEAVSLNAVVSAEGAFVAEPFSLIAADSVGLAAFGFEIARWDQMPPEALAIKD